MSPQLFSCTYSAEVPALLKQLGCSLLVSAPRSEALVLFYSDDGEKLVQRPRQFSAPLAVHHSGENMYVFSKGQIIEFRPLFDDASAETFFIPTHTFHCGPLQVHDLYHSGEALWMVNTEFSCLALAGARWSFEPRWLPPQLSGPVPGDCCHLNGAAFSNGRPLYVSALGTGTAPRSWKPGVENGGALWHVETREPVLTGLPLPHHPRMFDDGLFMLLSGTGEVVRVDPEARKYETIARLPGFVRGMDRIGQYLFVGLSKIRKGSDFQHLGLAASSLQ